MRFGISYHTGYYGLDPDRLIALAKHAEGCGFESFYLPEHVALYLGASIGPVQLDPTAPIADPLECLSFVAAETDRILLGTGVLLLPYHHPVVLAKRLSTLDVLSKGRLRLLTIGVGALPGEAAAVGIDYAGRGRRADEAMDILRLLWAGDETGVGFTGEFFSFSGVCSFPKPYRSSSLPIHVGGSSRRAARRAGRRGDGYFPGGALPPQERTAQIQAMRAAALEAGRDPGVLEYTRWGSMDVTAEAVESRVRQGIDRLVVAPTSADLEAQKDELSEFADRVGLLSAAS